MTTDWLIKMKRHDVAIIDYGLGNLFSVKQACDFVGLSSFITSDKKRLLNSTAAILPGVGAFGTAMTNLRKRDLASPIKDFIASGRPLMGICLGFQLLMSESEEFGRNKGLGIIRGQVKRFPNINSKKEHIKVPQVGWNQIFSTGRSKDRHWFKTPLDGIRQNEKMYFVHSFYVPLDNRQDVLSLTQYGGMVYCSSLMFENVFACQFHPEKSAVTGLKIYYNWSKQIRSIREKQTCKKNI